MDNILDRFKADRKELRIKLEFLFRTIAELWRGYRDKMDTQELIMMCSKLATSGGAAIHRYRVPNMFVISHEEDANTRHVAKLVVTTMDEVFQKISRETSGLPIPLKLPKETFAILESCDKLTDQLMDLYEKRVPFPSVETSMSPNYGRVNTYTCKQGHKTVTIDREIGVTPFTIQCPVCSGESESCSYKCDQALKPTHEFYIPTAAEVEKESGNITSDQYLDLLQHLAKGGLWGPRKIQEVSNG